MNDNEHQHLALSKNEFQYIYDTIHPKVRGDREETVRRRKKRRR
jgi:hypothetical protein